jgi:hypothetical protein
MQLINFPQPERGQARIGFYVANVIIWHNLYKQINWGSVAKHLWNRDNANENSAIHLVKS